MGTGPAWWEVSSLAYTTGFWSKVEIKPSHSLFASCVGGTSASMSYMPVVPQRHESEWKTVTEERVNLSDLALWLF